MSISETDRLLIELDTLRRTNDRYAEELRARDLAAVAPAEDRTNYRLQYAQKSFDQTLAEPKAVEELRAAAWVEWSLSPTGNLYADRAPRDGSWPEGMTPESYIRKFHGLNPEGSALLGEKPVEAEPVKLSSWLEAALTKARGGK